MNLGKTKRSRLIRRFLLNAVKAGNQQLIADAVESFGVSRQTIHNHLTNLVKMGFLEAQGNTRARTYSLGTTRSHAATLKLEGLRESDTYYREFGPIFSGLPEPIEEICHYGFTEILNNAVDHSGGSGVLISVDRTTEKINIMILDDGEGIFDHIARVMNLNDPRESILELSKGKLTTDPENHSGQGIFFTSRAFDRFLIFAGDLVFSHIAGKNEDELHNHEHVEKGTSVSMTISLNSSTTLKAVFEEFSGGEDEDYAFNKTVVPIKLALYEGERLVSRSQAKRILNRIEKFKFVQLDFEDVDFIGQAFADEIFRVFARKNPQIQLIEINTSEDVTRSILSAKSSA